jgi:hypothetical protein
VFTQTFPLDLAAIISGVEAAPADLVGLDCALEEFEDIELELLFAASPAAATEGAFGAVLPEVVLAADVADPISLFDFRRFRLFFVPVALASGADCAAVGAVEPA